MSLNTRGASQNRDYIRSIINDYDIIFLNETWCNNINILKDTLSLDENTFKMYHNSEREDDKIEENRIEYGPGHCPGGVAFIINKIKMGLKNIKYSYTKIDHRIILLIINNKTAIIGTYLPSNNNNYENKLEMYEELEELNLIMHDLNTKDIIIIGDQNSDLERKNNFDNIFINFAKRHKLKNAINDYKQTLNHTYFGCNNESKIDNVMIRENSNILQRATIIKTDPKNNFSDHYPIKIEAKIDTDIDINHTNKLNNDFPIWDGITKIVYNNELDKLMTQIDPNTQLNVTEMLDNNKCGLKISTLTTKLLSNMREAMSHISKSNLESKGIKYEVNWTTEEENAKIKLKSIKHRWFTDKSEEVKLELKLAKKRLKLIRSTNKKYVEEKLMSKLNKDFRLENKKYWKQLDKLLNQKVHSDINIDRAKDMFEELFNKEIINSTNNNIDYAELDNFIANNKNKKYNYSINDADLLNIMSNLNSNCAVGFSGIPNECFKYALGSNTVKIIKLILETYINYDIKPKYFNVGLVKIIVKDANKDHNDPNNLRPITISDTISIIFEKLMIIEINKTQKPKLEQFGFKSSSSCEHAVFTLREIVRFNRRRGRISVLCALDASKAFDKVKRNKLWLCMINKVEPHVIRALMNYYDDLKLIVNNNNEYSKIFGTTLGVKQGGPASPRLFTIYLEPLSDELNKCDVGINIGNLKINHLMYADDVLLICDTIADLNKLLSITSEYGIKYELKFNPGKTQFMICDRFRSKRRFDTPVFNGQRLERTYKLKYLGMHINPELKAVNHMDTKVKESYNKMVKLKRCGYSSIYTSSIVKINQYKTYIRSTLLYGSENQMFNKKEIKDLQTAESTLIKKAFGFNGHYTKSTHLNRALKLESIETRLIQSKYKFLIRLRRNELTNKLLTEIMDDGKSLNDRECLAGYLNKCNNKLSKTPNELLLHTSNNLKRKRKKYLKECNESITQRIKDILLDKGEIRKIKLAKMILMEEHWAYNYYNNMN